MYLSANYVHCYKQFGKLYTKGHDYSVHVALDVVVAGFENEPGDSFPINPTIPCHCSLLRTILNPKP